MSGESVPQGILQEIEIWPYEQQVYAQTKILDYEIRANHRLSITTRIIRIIESPTL